MHTIEQDVPFLESTLSFLKLSVSDLDLFYNKLKSLKVAKWMMNNELWMMNDEMNDEGWKFQAVWGFDLWQFDLTVLKAVSVKVFSRIIEFYHHFINEMFKTFKNDQSC